MAGFGIDGLASGLDTTSLINQLMQVEAMPQTLLKQKSSTTQSFVSALQGLNTKVASLAEAAAKAAKPESWSAFTATSSVESVVTTAGATAQPGTLTFSVDAVATTQVSLTDAVPDDGTLVPQIPPAVTVRSSDGTLVTVEPTTGSLQDIARAINEAADSGVKATVVRVTNGTTPTYRLQLTGTSTGTEGAFEIFAATSAEVTAMTDADRAAARLDQTSVRTAQDATVTLWKGAGPGIEQTFSQSSNTFSDLMTGVDITVSKVTGADEDPVTITVGQDTEALTKLASGIVGSLGVVLQDIGSRTATTTSTNSDGSTKVTGGLFTGDSMVRSIRDQLSKALADPADGFSPSEVGIVVGRDGTFTFDEEKFTAALAADPAKVQSMVSQIAGRVAEVAEGYSDKYDGTLTKKIESQQGLVKDFGSQIEDWDRRLEIRRASLQRTYSALEVTLSNLQSQSSWLAGQLGSLMSSSSS